MTKLSQADVERIAHLARLTLSPNNMDRYCNELSQILDLIEQMKEVDTSAVEPMSHPLDIQLRLRPDEVSEPDLRDRAQQLAPAVEGGFYLVPQVIETDPCTT